MDMNDLFNEKKQSPAGGPACWKGKKIHPTKPTKMKGGKRVNNCIDAGTNEEAELDEVKIPNNYAAMMAKKRKASPVKDRKTGKMYDPDKEFEKLKNSPEFKDQMKRMAKRDAVGESVDEATDFRKGDTVHEVGSKLKGTVLHKGNRDEVVVKFGTVNKSIPASQLRLVDELDEAAVCPQCGDPNCNCEPGTCDCEPVEESALDLSELRQLAGLGESYATAPYGDQEDTMVNYSKTKRMGDASVTVSANAKSMEELHQVLALAGLDPSAADKYAEPEEPCGCDDAEPEAEQSGPSTLNYRYETDKEKLIDIIKQRLQQKLS